MTSKRNTVVAGLVSLLLPMSVESYAGTLQETRAFSRDQLEDANQNPGASDVALENGEAISSFNGNLQVTHASAPIFRLDGDLSMTLTRTYNSHNVRIYALGYYYDHHFSGRSWVGIGWTSHLGRVYYRSRWAQNQQSGASFLMREKYFEFPDGSLYRFEPTVKNANPALKLTYFVPCDGSATPTPWPPEYCNRYPDAPQCESPPPNPCATRPPDDPEHYLVRFPNGTEYRMERLVADDERSDGWILNHDRAGFYATEITDITGNVVQVEYWGEGYPYPEAIKTIRSVQHPDSQITTELCTTLDPTSQCPAEALGMLKQVNSTGFQGTRAQPQQMIQRFYYSTVQVTDDDGTHTLPVLREVTTEGSGGESGGTIQYGYGVGQSLGQAVETYGPLLDRITYPLGAVSEYQYDQFWSGAWSYEPFPRRVVGVAKRTLYPSGLNPDGSISGRAHSSWHWSRDFRYSIGLDCAAGAQQGIVTNAYEQTSPDGRRIEFAVWGHPCGGTEPLEGPMGARKATTVLDGMGQPLRTVNTAFKYDTDIDEEVSQPLLESVETVFHDDSGVCFESAGGQERRIAALNRQRDSVGHWRMTVEGDGDYSRLVNGAPVRRVTYTNYQGLTGCWASSHLSNTFDYRFVEEGDQRIEENVTFDCDGRVVQSRMKDEWQVASTDPGTGTPIEENADDDGDDLRSVMLYDVNENPNLSQVSTLGGDTYPDLTPANTYAATIEASRGVAVSTQIGGLTYPTSDLTVDPGGQVAVGRDPNGLETRFDFDGLGRPTAVYPPGTVEQTTRYIYPDLNHVRTITSAGTETAFDPNATDQLYTEQELDGLGRPVQVWKAMPDGTRSTRITRYDQMGRVIFISEWMEESSYAAATKVVWASGDVDGDGTSGDYFVDGIPVDGTEPRGSRVFYGTPDPADPENPLLSTPDGLGRVRRVVATDGAVTRMDYCGPHEQITVEGVATGLSGETDDAVTRNYYDALGRLVLVDAPDQSADAEYSYDARGNLIRANLIDQLPADAFAAWRDGEIPEGQLRTFEYDAAGRLLRTDDPESGERVVKGYDAGGNPLTWQDQMAINRGYHFRATYDTAGRTTRVERILGTPEDPATEDVSRIGGAGDFEESSDVTANGQVGASWREGSISGSTFNSGQTDWKQVSYGGCLPSAPPGGSNLGALYMGTSSTCTYSSMGSGQKAVRRLFSNVERDDVLSFKYWREVRQGGAGKDRLLVFAKIDAPGSQDDNDVSGARYLFELDAAQASYATWRQTPDMRPGDMFSEAEWPEPTPGSPSTKNIYIYIAFEKGDTADTGSARGVLIDDVFLGRRHNELIAEHTYDTDECDQGAVVDACIGEEATNHYKGALTRTVSYQSGRKLMEERLAYKGLNGRLSGRDMRIDWAGVGQLVTFADRYWYTDQGQMSGRYAPYDTAGISNPPSRYLYAYKRGFADGLSTDDKEFLSPGLDPPSLDYSSAGVLQAIRFANGTSEQIALDEMHRVDWIRVNGPGGTYWDSNSYAFDGAGNIKAIGGQAFSYDLAGRLTGAKVLPQATDASETDPVEVQYAYDTLGNMTSRAWSQPGQSSSPPAGMAFEHGYGSRNQIVGSPNYAYDANGNSTRTLAADTPAAATWSATGLLTAFYNGQPELGPHRVAERYCYDARGSRVMKSSEGASGDGRVMITIRDVGGAPLSEFVVDPLIGWPQRDRDYLWGGGRLLVERKLMPVLPGGGEGLQGGGASAEGGGVDPCEIDPEAPGCGGGGGGGGGEPEDPTHVFVEYFHHRDHLGSLRVVTDEAGAVVGRYDLYPFGFAMASSGSGISESRMRYTVHERDAATGADYMMARYKIGSSESFLSADPVYDVSAGAPSSWNRYAYVRSNAIAALDPDGQRYSLCPECNQFLTVDAFGPVIPGISIALAFVFGTPISVNGWSNQGPQPTTGVGQAGSGSPGSSPSASPTPTPKPPCATDQKNRKPKLQFLNDHLTEAGSIAKALKTDPAFVLAHAAIESGWGGDPVATSARNFFGLKVGTAFTGTTGNPFYYQGDNYGVYPNPGFRNSGMSWANSYHGSRVSGAQTIADYASGLTQSPRPFNPFATIYASRLQRALKDVEYWLPCAGMAP